METSENSAQQLSPAWRYAVVVTVLIGMAVLIYISISAYRDAPPIPSKVVDPSGRVVYTGADVMAGQEVFLRYGLMANGTIWGHGAYLGPDFSAQYLHTLGEHTAEGLVAKMFQHPLSKLTAEELEIVAAEVAGVLKKNRYDAGARVLVFTGFEADSYTRQIALWARHFSDPELSGGLSPKYITDLEELRQLTAFFSWTAWAAVANRPGKNYSYTNNFPYDPSVGNRATPDALLWSMLSIITFLGGLAAVLFVFGRFEYLGWKPSDVPHEPRLVPGNATESQRATIKFFVVVSLLFLVQVLVGGGTAHFRAEPGSFYGFDLASIFPSNILRTWHLQLAIFWVATAYIAGGLLIAPSLSDTEPRLQKLGINLLFWALVLVVGGSLFGELLGIRQALGDLWFWFGHQGWEFLELGRMWQVLLTVGFVLWLVLVYRAVGNGTRSKEYGELATLFIIAAATIPIFYIPAFFFDSVSNYAVVDMWRFWIIHLWVEGFFEIFVTAMVAVIFYQLGMVTHRTAIRVIYLDAILFLGGGIVGTAHHWYWTGQSVMTMAFAAMYSAMEVVPLTLLTLDAWSFVRVTRSECPVCGVIPHKWTFYFLMAVGFWNFVGAGIFGFLINLPIVSYFEVGTMLTPNHGHAAFMGAFGMLAMALLVLGLRHVLTEEQWAKPEKFIKVSFWGLNIGLALMILLNLFPGGVMQLRDVLDNGYWHARNLGYLNQRFVRMIEWFRLPGDAVFIALGVVPAVIASVMTYVLMLRGKGEKQGLPSAG
ncbi:MAG: cbb3-type cytochrome c oxidase subunit I [Syntrophobacteraceae bacterium]